MGVLNTNTGEVFFNLNKSFSVKGKHQFRSSKQKPAYTNLMIRSKQYRYLNHTGLFYWISKSPTEETSWSAWLKHQPIGIQTFVEKILPTIRVDDEQKVHMNQQIRVVIHTHLIYLVQKRVIRNIGWNPEISDKIRVCSSLTLHVKGTVRHIYLSSLPPVQSLYNKQTY